MFLNLQLAFGAIAAALWFLDRFKFAAADTAELAHWILALSSPRLKFLRSEVGLRIRTKNVLNNLFSARKNIGRGIPTHAAQKCIGRAELVRVVSLMLDGISHGARSDCRKYNGVSEVQIGHSLYHGGQCPVAAFR